MALALLFWPEADASLTALEHNRHELPALRAVRRTLDRLARDRHDAQLRTRHFASTAIRHVRATPVNHGDWYVFWQPGAEPQTLEILEISERPL